MGAKRRKDVQDAYEVLLASACGFLWGAAMLRMLGVI